MMRGAQSFGRRGLLALVAGGALIFLLLLYAIGAGWTGNRDRDGGAHAAANGLNGYSALVALLQAQGQQVSLSRSPSALETNGLLILTPTHGTDAEALRDLLAERAYYGPTLVILPKWFAARLSDLEQSDAPQGWVRLIAAQPPDWVGELGLAGDITLESDAKPGWSGMGLEGNLPGRATTQFLTGSGLTSVIAGPEGEALAAYAHITENDPDRWPIIILAEPDLLNNQGLADKVRALAAVRLMQMAREGEEFPIIFDLTLPGLGQRPNLLTLAFQPPFLAATLCLLLAALVIAWRGFHRFGAALVEVEGMVPGKRLLAANGAALIERAGRAHLLGAPYATLATARLAKRLGISEAYPDRQEAAITRIARLRGHGELDLTAALEALRKARRPAELLHAARAMRHIERTLLP